MAGSSRSLGNLHHLDEGDHAKERIGNRPRQTLHHPYRRYQRKGEHVCIRGFVPSRIWKAHGISAQSRPVHITTPDMCPGKDPA